MSIDLPVQAPAGFAPEMVIAFGNGADGATIVEQGKPLPVASIYIAATATRLTGTANASAIVGPFTPQLSRDMRLTLSGSWVGTVQLLRSTDGGTTKLPLTAGGVAWASFSANANEKVETPTETGETYYLSITLTSGSVTYRLAQ